MSDLDVRLRCHPAAPSPGWLTVEAQVARRSDDRARLRYRLTGDLKRVLTPPARPPRRVDDLWRHTCCEAFLRVEGRPEYWELNLSPSTAWALWRFESYRAGASVPRVGRPPAIEVRRAPDVLELQAELELPTPVAVARRADVRLGLAVVVEEVQGELSYWAPAHPCDRPDFHHPDTMRLPLR